MKKKILIIDDDKVYTELVKAILERTGKYEVGVENRGLHGLGTAKRFKPDLILMDIMMPHTDGFQIMKLLKNDLDTISIPIIMLSAVDSDESKTAAAASFNEDYIVRPIAAEALEKKIEEVLNRYTA